MLIIPKGIKCYVKCKYLSSELKLRSLCSFSITITVMLWVPPLISQPYFHQKVKFRGAKIDQWWWTFLRICAYTGNNLLKNSVMLTGIFQQQIIILVIFVFSWRKRKNAWKHTLKMLKVLIKIPYFGIKKKKMKKI